MIYGYMIENKSLIHEDASVQILDEKTEFVDDKSLWKKYTPTILQKVKEIKGVKSVSISNDDLIVKCIPKNKFDIVSDVKFILYDIKSEIEKQYQGRYFSFENYKDISDSEFSIELWLYYKRETSTKAQDKSKVSKIKPYYEKLVKELESLGYSKGNQTFAVNYNRDILDGWIIFNRNNKKFVDDLYKLLREFCKENNIDWVDHEIEDNDNCSVLFLFFDYDNDQDVLFESTLIHEGFFSKIKSINNFKLLKIRYDSLMKVSGGRLSEGYCKELLSMIDKINYDDLNNDQKKLYNEIKNNVNTILKEINNRNKESNEFLNNFKDAPKWTTDNTHEVINYINKKVIPTLLTPDYKKKIRAAIDEDLNKSPSLLDNNKNSSDYKYIKNKNAIPNIKATWFEDDIIELLSEESQSMRILMFPLIVSPIAKVFGADFGDGDEGCIYLR